MAEFLGMIVGKNIRLFRLMFRFIRRHKFISVLCTGMLIMFLSLSVFNNVNAEGKDEFEFKYYSVITIDKGDTLWSIASSYHDGEDLRGYISEVMRVNHLSSQTIYPGDKLVIPYYSNEFYE